MSKHPLRVSLTFALIHVSCSLEYQSGLTECSNDGRCPTDFICSAGRCYRSSDSPPPVPPSGGTGGSTVSPRSPDAGSSVGPRPPPDASATPPASDGATAPAACTQPIPTVGIEQTNASVILAGAAYGTGEIPNTMLRRKFDVLATGAPPGLVVGPAFALLDDPEEITWVIQAKNTTGWALGFTDSQDVTFRNGAGQVVYEALGSFEYGSAILDNNDSSNLVYVLADGETGYLIMHGDDTLGTPARPLPIATVELMVALSPRALKLQSTTILPVAYDFTNNQLRIKARNVGCQAATASFSSDAVLLDSDGPVSLRDMTLPASFNDYLMPGQETIFTETYPRPFKGRVTQIRTRVLVTLGRQ